MQTKVRSDVVVWIRKRSSDLQEFDIRKIKKAMGCAFLDTQPFHEIPNLQELAEEVVEKLEPDNSGAVDIEVVQDVVENTLMDRGFND